MDENHSDPAERCSFCRKNRGHVRFLIAAPRSSICDECVLLSVRILAEKKCVSRFELFRLLFA